MFSKKSVSLLRPLEGREKSYILLGIYVHAAQYCAVYIYSFLKYLLRPFLVIQILKMRYL